MSTKKPLAQYSGTIEQIQSGDTIDPTVLPNLTVTSQSTTYSILSTDDLVLCDCSGGAFTVTLPDATTVKKKPIRIKKTDSSSNYLTVGTTSSQTIDGSTTQTISVQYTTLEVISDGSNWRIT